MKDKMTRGEFLRSLLLIGFGAAGSGALISSCGGGGGEESTQTASQPKQSRPKASKPAASADPCADVSALTETELQMRNETLKYVPASPDPAKLCDNCKFWVPAADGATCGTCQLVKGPINPKGYCTSWFIMDS